MRYVVVLKDKKDINKIIKALKNSNIAVHGTMSIAPVIFASMDNTQMQTVSGYAEVKRIEISTKE